MRNIPEGDLKTIKIIAKVVANCFNLSKEKLFQKTRIQEVVVPRKIFYLIVRRKIGSSITTDQLGAFPRIYKGAVQCRGGVRYSIETIQDEMSVNRELAMMVRRISFLVDDELNPEIYVPKNTKNKIRNLITRGNISAEKLGQIYNLPTYQIERILQN